MNIQEIKTTVDELGYAFETFKQNNEERLAMITKGQDIDPLLDQKISAIHHSIDQAERRLVDLEHKQYRPYIESIEGSHPIEGTYKKAFLNYLRKGGEEPLIEMEMTHKSLSTDSDPNGGYLVPDFLSNNILSTIQFECPLRQLASHSVISTDTLEILVDTEDAEAGWVGEKDPREETSMGELKKIRIPVHELYAKPRATQKLLDDARINVEQWLLNKIVSQMAVLENKSFIRGSGKGEPKGFLSHPRAVGAHRKWGVFEEIKSGFDGALVSDKDQEGDRKAADLLLDVMHSLKERYLSQATWVLSRPALAAIRKLKTPNLGTYLWQPSLSAKTPSTLLGYPVTVIDDMPDFTAGTKSTPIAFGNFKAGYHIVDRAGIRVMRDPYSSKPFVEFYTTKRVGGDVTNFDAIKFLTLSA